MVSIFNAVLVAVVSIICLGCIGRVPSLETGVCLQDEHCGTGFSCESYGECRPVNGIFSVVQMFRVCPC